jgi:hypothetical protein
VTIFDGASWERVDDRKNYGEERWVSVGMLHGVEITVLYTDQPWRTTSFAGSFPLLLLRHGGWVLHNYRD